MKRGKFLLLFISLLFICGGCAPVISLKKSKEECGRGIDFGKFENVYRAGKSLENITDDKVNYKEFEERLQNLATAISVAEEKVLTEKEKELLTMYSEAYTAYRDSAVLWKYTLYRTFDPEVEEEARPVLEKYNIPLSYSSSREGYEVPKFALTVILKEAIEKIREVNTLLNPKIQLNK